MNKDEFKIIMENINNHAVIDRPMLEIEPQVLADLLINTANRVPNNFLEVIAIDSIKQDIMLEMSKRN